MVDLVKSTQREGYDVDDEAEVSTTATESSYVVGANQRAINATYWTSGVEAQEVMFYCTEDCFIRFDASDARQHRLFASTYYTFTNKVTTIYYQRVSANGTLYIWMSG